MVEKGSQTNPDRSEVDETGGSSPLASENLPTTSLKELVEFLAKNLVTKPEAVQVSESSGGEGCVLELRVDKEDLGRVIGKQGRTAKSLRILLSAAASRAKTKASLEIVED